MSLNEIMDKVTVSYSYSENITQQLKWNISSYVNMNEYQKWEKAVEWWIWHLLYEVLIHTNPIYYFWLVLIASLSWIIMIMYKIQDNGYF